MIWITGKGPVIEVMDQDTILIQKQQEIQALLKNSKVQLEKSISFESKQLLTRVNWN